MKKLGNVLGITPGCAARLERAGIGTTLDLAKAIDLSGLSDRSQVPVGVLRQCREFAYLEVATARHRRYLVVGLGFGAAILLFLLVLRFQRQGVSPDLDRAVAEYNRGNALYEEGRLDDAALEYRRALALGRETAFAHNNLGVVSLKKGDYETAIAEFREAYTAKADYAEAHRNAGIAFLEMASDGVSRTDPNYAEAQLRLAVAQLRRATALRGDDPVALSDLGFALWRYGDYNGAIQQAKKALKLNPRVATAHNTLGLALQTRGERNPDATARRADFDAAAAEYRTAIKLQPGSAAPYYNLGNTLMDLHEYDSAVTQYAKALAITPNDLEARNNLGNALAQSGRYDAAISEFRAILAAAPGFVTARLDLARALLDKGDYTGAILESRRAVALEPNFAGGHYNLAAALSAVGQKKEADLEFREAKRLDPNFAKPQH